MAKKKKSDSDFITEAVLAATKKRISKMSGAELKASVDRMAAQEKPGTLLPWVPLRCS